MTWLAIYLFCAAFGGVLLGASLLLGGHGDADHGGDTAIGHDAHVGDHDAHVGDHEADAHADHGSDAHGHAAVAPHHGGGIGAMLSSWSLLPFTSLRFWTFVLAAFGGSGVLLTFAGLPSGVVATVSVAIGWLVGWGSFQSLRWLTRQEVSGAVGLRSYVDHEARVLLPVRPGQVGKVVVETMSGRVELVATTHDPAALEVGSAALIVAVDGEGRAEVTTLSAGTGASANGRARSRVAEGAP